MKWQLLGIGTLVSLHTFTADAQTIASDSQGKDIFTFRQTGKRSATVKSASKALELNYEQRIFSPIQYFVPRMQDTVSFKAGKFKLIGDSIISIEDKDDSLNNSRHFTVSEGQSISITGNIGNVASNLLDISSSDLSWGVGLGYGKNIDAFNNMANIFSLKGKTLQSWHVGAHYERQPITLLDTANAKSYKQGLYQVGINVEWNIYFKPRPKLFWGVVLTGALDYGKSAKNLGDYELYESKLITESLISITGKTGKLGTPENVATLRGSIAFPMMPRPVEIKYKKVTQTTLQLTYVPYYVIEKTMNGKTENRIGGYLNVAEGQDIFANNSSIISGLGIGSDYAIGAKKLQVFVSGTINITKMLYHKPAEQASNQK
ncbi:hypothetical protein DVR12_14695 [Chitinophaga silvatica]|uniref:Uncharacterized protein n=1 Tax=Chitinophaga silvatica TaxID=2282649 RepID=A0A3E1Y914_9BACT|nr:hypothetical protein [Chitinophaga silvatica]RFS21897.1 hypothetical protein DVR12_14695 [Chitinophaga silvatica]